MRDLTINDMFFINALICVLGGLVTCINSNIILGVILYQIGLIEIYLSFKGEN